MLFRRPWGGVVNAVLEQEPVPAEVARRAVEWLVELQSEPVPAAVRREWEQWRGSHPDHERAWRRIEAVNGKLRSLGGPDHPAVASALLTRRGSVQRRQAVKTLALLFFTGGAAWLVEERTPWRIWTADENTAVGARGNLVLDDGTRVAMNSGSALDVRYDAAQRRLHLLAGEILVTTAADDDRRRPFLVRTPQGALRALGTRFVVRLHPASTQVGVFDGAVELRPLHGAAPRVLLAGQQAWFGMDAYAPARQVDEDSVAWTDGLLISKGMRLEQFLAELGRYSAVALSCAPAAAGLRVSGSYRLDDVDRVLETLAATLSLDIETTTRFFGRYRSGVRLAPRAAA